MPKEALKRRTSQAQDGRCALSGEKLPEKTKLYDTHRRTPKREGGIYDKENTSVVVPIRHMEEHNTLRVRTPELEELKAIIDGREQISKISNSYQNRLDANKRRTDKLEQDTVDWLTEQKEVVSKKLREIDKRITGKIKSMDSPFVKAALGVKGVGPVSIAYWLIYVDINEARHASSIWKYVGIHTASHERYEKGQAGGGNKSLRTMFYTTALSQMQGRGPYRVYYDNVKNRLAISEKITKSRNTQGMLKEMKWRDTKPCHRHGAALRAVMKHLFNDFWFVHRELSGLDTSPGYAEAQLGKGHGTINPRQNGWVW